MSDPWLEAFRRDPGQAVADLFSGRAGASSDLRLDVPELLYQQFPQSLVAERAQLDDALGSWLSDMREGYASQVQRLGFSVYGKRVGDALVALQLLDLPRTRGRIRTDPGAWLGWLSPLRLAPERDPGLECFRLLTRGQPDARHTALWLRLAADPRPECLTVALAGLRLLPNQGNARKNQVLMLQALLRHAAGIHHDADKASTFFNRHLAALRGLFPRSPQHWNRVLNEALDDFLEHTEEPMARELAHVLRTGSQDKRRRLPSGKARMPMPATQDEWKDLKDDILEPDHPPEMLAQRLLEILERNHEYAKATGVSHFFVRTLHNLGNALLEHCVLGLVDMARFGVMIERALVWKPADPYCWMLWADWFKAQGHRDAQEATLREMLRLSPSDLPARVELARLLIARGEVCWDEAEHHLQSVIDRDPSNEPSRVVMDQLLVLRRRGAEAEAVLAKLLEQYPDSPTARESLDRSGDPVYLDSATTASESVRDSETQEGGDHDDPPIPPSNVMEELLRRGSLAGEFSRALIAGDRGLAASTDRIRQESRKGDPLAGFYSQWLMPEDTPESPPHAWAWKACRYWQEPASPDRWQDLATQFPEAAPETEFLRVLAAPDDGNGPGPIGWRGRSGNNDASRPVDALLREAQERLVGADSHERDDLARTVMACAATDAPGAVSTVQ